ncbi:MAG: thioredoxin family protein [Bacteroidia bacterium]|nr:thioredoxin family protein [Bacteroidia bacterium]
MTTNTKNEFETYIRKGMKYNEYVAVISDLVSEGRTTGETQSDELAAYTKLNLQRMERIYKTVVLFPELVAKINAIHEPQTWLCITEGWCGDAAQNLPVFARLAELNPLVTMRIVLRDENLELMDKYLTNGGRSIPKIIAIEAGNEKWNWGPRPATLQEKYIAFKQKNFSHDDLVKELHTWYAHNKGTDTQKELIQLI